MKNLFLFFVLLPSLAFADASDAQFERDKQLALKQSAKLSKQCLNDFIKQHAEVKITGAPRFDDEMSRKIYKELYWKDSDRGLAFVLPVRIENTNNAELACYYAVTQHRLEFQYAQLLPVHL